MEFIWNSYALHACGSHAITSCDKGVNHLCCAFVSAFEPPPKNLLVYIVQALNMGEQSILGVLVGCKSVISMSGKKRKRPEGRTA
ncbi:hypothetical protein K438DRAFT_1817737 [Mycena galopus ATCC 62051]|nr:hypothetical protein K438DRAFT_1817737 [Mycena galopus ATCC 62051]